MSEKISLSELQAIIKDTLYLAHPGFYWVAAEVSEITENSTGHCYLELIEKHPDDKNVRARVKAIIWSNRYRFLKSFFENITGESLKEGLKILVKAKVEYHELYGLSLIISDIDPAFTIGEMAMKRQMVIKRLEEEGVFSMNKELNFPGIPQRIAVISSKNAAGYTDFVNHLKNNSYGYVFYTALFDTVMQGNETEQSVLSALDKIAGYPGLFDVAVIIRGGGSVTDLSWFDSYNIAYYVTQFPIPVLTGIGHEKDLSVTDMVAYQSLKTPTAVAGYLIDSLADAETRLNEMSQDISRYSLSIIEENRKVIDRVRISLIPVARLIISDNKSEVEKMRLNLMSNVLNSLEKMKMKCESFSSALSILDPDNVLRRGYTITTMNSRLIKSAGDVKAEDLIDTRFSDGRIESKVIGRQKTKDKRQKIKDKRSNS
ncbi:MAG: exodeoxyribonuclease VII large subunit [Bacteroidales bacterium]|jgi:exodeoxyribonuclease VII large subunit|nr:exodeoxyribonuclease VII large subunit [Bacteroidales bacterium]